MRKIQGIRIHIFDTPVIHPSNYIYLSNQRTMPATHTHTRTIRNALKYYDGYAYHILSVQAYNHFDLNVK